MPPARPGPAAAPPDDGCRARAQPAAGAALGTPARCGPSPGIAVARARRPEAPRPAAQPEGPPWEGRNEAADDKHHVQLAVERAQQRHRAFLCALSDADLEAAARHVRGPGHAQANCIHLVQALLTFLHTGELPDPAPTCAARLSDFAILLGRPPAWLKREPDGGPSAAGWTTSSMVVEPGILRDFVPADTMEAVLRDGVVEMLSTPGIDLASFRLVPTPMAEVEPRLREMARQAGQLTCYGCVCLACAWDEPGHCLVYVARAKQVWFVDAQRINRGIGRAVHTSLEACLTLAGSSASHRRARPFSSEVFLLPVHPTPTVQLLRSLEHPSMSGQPQTQPDHGATCRPPQPWQAAQEPAVDHLAKRPRLSSLPPGPEPVHSWLATRRRQAPRAELARALATCGRHLVEGSLKKIPASLALWADVVASRYLRDSQAGAGPPQVWWIPAQTRVDGRLQWDAFGATHDDLLVLALAAALEPADAAGQHHLGMALLALRQAREAFRVLERAAALTAHDPHLHYHRGKALFQLHRLRDAEAAFARAIALDPTCAPAHLGLGKMQGRLSGPQAGHAAILRALALWPELAQHPGGGGLTDDPSELPLPLIIS